MICGDCMLLVSVFAGIIILFLVVNSIYSFGFSRKNEYYDSNNDDYKKYQKSLPVPYSKIIKAKDNVELFGDIYINEQKNKKTVVIIIHGYGCSRRSVIGIASAYYNDFGYSVMLPDLRAHGESGGKYIGFGWCDSEDIICWIKYLEQMLGDNIKIILHGISMGGATALLTAAKNSKSVNAIISDCSFSSIKDILTLRLKKDFNLPEFPFIHLIDWMVKHRCNYSIKDGNVKEEVKKIQCPVLYIHGQNDNFIPVENVYVLYENTSSYKKIYICPEAGHAESAITDPLEYKERIHDFLNYVFN